MYKLIVLASVLAVACGNTLVYHAGSPVVHTAAVPLTYHAGVVHHPIVHNAAVPVAYSAGVVHRPLVYTSAVHQTVPVVHTTGTKVVHSYKPVEQHGYQIAY